MPKYTFECNACQIRFSRVLKMGSNPTCDCPECKEEVPRLFEDFGFGFKVNPNSATANTGVHDNDYPTADKAVGRSAHERWAQYDERKKVKEEARKLGGTHALIRKDGDGYVEYEAMSTAGREARRKLTKETLPKFKKSQ